MRKKLNDCLQKSNKLVYFTAVNNDAIQGRWNNVETAPHHAWKKLSALLMTLALMMTLLPAALAVDLNVDAGFYFKQSRGGTCTLASAAMMLRRRAYFDGLDGWVDVTENSIKSTAWAGGLSHSFTYNAMHVGYATLPSGKAAKTEALIRILQEHPEGIVLYDRSQPHAVLLTDYTNGVFHCSDPAGNISSGRIPLTSSSVSVNGASCYWYVTSDHNSVASAADGLRLEGMSYPVNIQVGKGMALTGTANSASGTTLTSVQVAILDTNDQPVQTAQAVVEGTSFSFKSVDGQIKFGELAEGTYTYMVMLTDSNGETLCFTSDFTVSDGSSSTATYWSAQDTEGAKLSEGIQQIETTLTDAAETTMGWLTSLFG